MKICDYAGNVHIVRKYVISNDGEESVWSNTWYGRHVIGNDCKWVNESKPQSEPLPDSSKKRTKLEIMQAELSVEELEFFGDQLGNLSDCMEEYKNQELAASTVPEAGEDAIEVLKDIMLKFGNAHDMLAKSKLTKEEYQPISSLLAKGKIELFNFYQLYRKQSKQ